MTLKEILRQKIEENTEEGVVEGMIVIYDIDKLIEDLVDVVDVAIEDEIEENELHE